MRQSEFYDTYGISKLDFAELIHVDVRTLRRYLNGDDTINDTSRKKIETGLSILDSEYFQFTPLKDCKDDYYIDRIARYEEEDRQKAEFTKIFEQWMYQGGVDAIREDQA